MIHCKNHKHKSLIHKSTSKFSDLLVFKQSSSSGCFVFLAHVIRTTPKNFFLKMFLSYFQVDIFDVVHIPLAFLLVRDVEITIASFSLNALFMIHFIPVP